jgi:hypothetical protein
MAFALFPPGFHEFRRISLLFPCQSRMLVTMPSTRTERSAHARAAAQSLAEERRAKKILAIGERRAAARGLTREKYVAEIVKGNFPPITAEDIAAEPTPE